jgi:hypothetical protein
MLEHCRANNKMVLRVDKVYRGRFAGIASRFVGGTWDDAHVSLVEDVIAAEAGGSNVTLQWRIVIVPNRDIVRYFEARQRAAVCRLSWRSLPLLKSI